MFLGKLLAALVVPLLASYLGMTVFLLTVYSQGTWWFDWVFLLQIYTLATVNGLVMISGAVVISTQATSMRAANLLSAFIILPMAALLLGQSVIIVPARYQWMNDTQFKAGDDSLRGLDLGAKWFFVRQSRTQGTSLAVNYLIRDADDGFNKGMTLLNDGRGAALTSGAAVKNVLLVRVQVQY